jgi:hypothetical protein
MSGTAKIMHKFEIMQVNFVLFLYYQAHLKNNVVLRKKEKIIN